MRRFGPGLMAVLVLALPVRAQVADDPMELQRCVWRCLTNSPDAASAACHQCVADVCAGPGTATADPILPAPVRGVAPRPMAVAGWPG